MKGAFSIKSKKTPYQRHKELEEEKKRKADEEAAKIYEEFVESFKADEGPGRDSGVKAFVRGGVVAPGSRSHEATGGSGTKYVPGGASAAAPAAKRFEPGRVHQRHDAFADDDEEEEEESVFKLPSKKPADKDKPRQIDKMLEQLKKEQEDREERDRLRREGKPVPPELSFQEDGEGDRGGDRDRGRDRGGPGAFGSYDEGDPFTTNLYVGNIHPEVNEAHLAREFGRFGPIGSVKIMWPRDEEQRRRGRNCGFVAFMNRPDAEAARKALDGLALHGMELNIGWGKAVPLPPVPLYSGHGVPTGPLTAIVPPAVTRERGNPLTLALQSALVPAQGMYAKESTMSRTMIKGMGIDIEVRVPDDSKQRFIIDSMALYVLKDGCEFEQLIMMEQQGRPEYRFLFDLDSPEHIYYRWRLYSLAEGDTLRTWRIDPYIMVEGGQAWVPPPMLAADIAAGEKRQEITAQRGQQVVLLSDYDRDRLEDMLRALTAERSVIAEAMVFALENADAAGDVVEVLEEALTLPETPPATKLARLYLVNDILANATAPVRNASRYRVKLEACLPEIFVSFMATQKAAESRMVQEALRRAVLRLLRVWRDRFIFNDDYINGLQATFLGQIPILEAGEEEEQQQQLEAAVATAAVAGPDSSSNPDGPVASPTAATKSRWEAMEEEDNSQQQQQQQQQQQSQQQQQQSGPTRAQLRLINPKLTEELEGLANEELERKCRLHGLSNKGSRQLLIDRLLALDYYLHADERGPLPSVEAAAAALSAPTAAATAANSRWQSVDGAAAAGAAGGTPLEDESSGGKAGSRWSSSTITIPLSGQAPGVPVKLEDGAMADAAAAASFGQQQQQQQHVAAVGQPSPAAAAIAASRWQEVDEEAEREAAPQVPISKWLLEEAEAEAQRKAAEEAAQQEAAAAAAAREAAAKEAAARAAIAANAAAAAVGGGDGGGSAVKGSAAGKTSAEAALDEERRKRLRQIEVQVLDHQEELQERGQTQAAAEAAAAELRQQLVAQLDADMEQQAAAAAAAAAAKSPAVKPSSSKGQKDRSNRDKGDNDSRDRDRDKGGKESSRDKGKESREKERDARNRSSRKRSRSRSRSSSRGRSKSRSRSRSRGRGRSSSSKQQQTERDRKGGAERLQRGDSLRVSSRSGKGDNKESRGDRDRDRDKDKDKDRDRDKDRHKDKDRDSKRSSRRSRSRSKSRSRSGSRERRRGGRSRSSRSRSRSPEKDRDRRGSKRHRS